jgi:predicted lipoprotein with Yx(FWY)xxD motif
VDQASGPIEHTAYPKDHTMNRTLQVFLGTLLTTAAVTAVQAQPVVRDGIVTDPAGRTLYIFDRDETLKSRCEAACLQAWPAYGAEAQAGVKVPGDAKRFEQGERQQWAWQGKPLYYFAGDARPGDKNGDGSGGVWHVIRPAASTAAPAAATKPTSAYNYTSTF